MQVTVKLFAYFRDNRFKESVIAFSTDTTPEKVIGLLGIDPDEVGVIMVNNRHAQPDRKLRDNDVLAVFPKIGGG